MSELKVNSIKGVGASTAAITVNNSDGTCTANITNNLSNRNLIINGAMQVAQRGTSSTSNHYATVDRFRIVHNGDDEAPTQAQVDVASGTTPYTLGFRKALRITNGNQTSGAGSNDVISITQRVEAQNMATSGWNYVSSSSYVTLSFWVKSSVAQNFYIRLTTSDGTQKSYPMETGSLTADTWTKFTKAIPGHADLQFDLNADTGLNVDFSIFRGTDQTASGVTLDQWSTNDQAAKIPDMTSTWYTTNDATFEITGVQLEVGSVATDFEHKSYAQELQLCKRYYQKCFDYHHICVNNGESDRWIRFPVEMRASPTVTTAPTNSVTFAAANQQKEGFSGNGSGSGSANFNLEWTASAEL